MSEGIQSVLRLDADESLLGDNQLYFSKPQQLLQLFKNLEEENLVLIQVGTTQARSLYIEFNRPLRVTQTFTFI